MRWLLAGALIATPAWWLRDRSDLNARTYRYTGTYTLVRTYPNGKYLIRVNNRLIKVSADTTPPPTKTGVLTNDGFEIRLRVS